MKFSVVVTCEHAGKALPRGYKTLFRGNQKILNSHRGWDEGAIGLAKMLSEKLSVPLHYCETTRLLIEVNRSLDHPQLFSEFTNELSSDRKEKIINMIYLPYRNAVLASMHELKKPVFHISVHSFTPVWEGEERKVDIGILFDPKRPAEVKRCDSLKRELTRNLPAYRVKLNEPYKGTDDGFTCTLRKYFPDHQYTGIEIEVNQKIVEVPMIQAELVRAIRSVAIRYKHFI